MKKIFAYLGGMVFTVAILSSISLPQKRTSAPGNQKPDSVNIYLRWVTNHNVKKLLMTDSHGESAYNNLITTIRAGGNIKWILDKESGIISIDSVWTKETPSKAFARGNGRNSRGDEFGIQIRPEARGKYKYSIEFTVSGEAQKTIDPYIRVNPPDDK